MSTILAEFTLPVDLQKFMTVFWLDVDFYERFLSEKLEDLSIEIGAWTAVGGAGDNSAAPSSSSSMTRNIRSYHPSKISFPGLPSHAESLKQQTFSISEGAAARIIKAAGGGGSNSSNSSNSESKATIVEVNTFRGIPYADYFAVNTKWQVTCQLIDGQEAKECSVSISLDFSFYKSTWLQGTIESNTKAELIGVYEQWLAFAEEHLRAIMDVVTTHTHDSHALLISMGSNSGPLSCAMDEDDEQERKEEEDEDDGDDDDDDDDAYNNRTTSSSSSSSSSSAAALSSSSSSSSLYTHQQHVHHIGISSQPMSHVSMSEDLYIGATLSHKSSGLGGMGGVRRASASASSSSSSSSSSNSLHRLSHSHHYVNDSDDEERGGAGGGGGGGGGRGGNNGGRGGDGYQSDEDIQFYDCVEGGNDGGGGGGGVNGRRQSLARSNSFWSRGEGEGSGGGGTGGGGTSRRSSMSHLNSQSGMTSQELHDLYSDSRQQGSGSGSGGPQSAKDLAVTFVETAFVLAEFSFWTINRLYTHDMKELFNIEPTDVLSRIFNTFLPGWHSPQLLQPDFYGPLIGVFLLPQVLLLSMEVSKHGCNQTSMLGNAAVVSLCLWLGLSFLYRVLSFFIAPSIGLKQCVCVVGYSFFAWDVALLCSYPIERYSEFLGLPLALPLVLFGIPAALAQGAIFWELTPASNITLQPTSFPSSLQQFAQQNSRTIQRVLWAIPKLAAFVVVAGTHYQLLWYLARVFLPGRKQLCQLSALVQPSQYADILSQKELRKYALMLLNGNKNDD